jgi:hypothetical protein
MELIKLKESKKSPRFRLKWYGIYADIIWENVQCKYLNVWYLFLSSVTIISLADYNLNQIINQTPPLIQNWFSTTITYIFYICEGIVASSLVIPVMTGNSIQGAKNTWRILYLYLVPICALIVFTINWRMKTNSSQLIPIVVWILGTFACFGCLFYIFSVFNHVTVGYVEYQIQENKKYVQNLLKGKKKKEPHLYSASPSRFRFTLHPILDLKGDEISNPHSNIISTTESDIFLFHPPSTSTPSSMTSHRSLEDFFSTLCVKEIFLDVFLNTPQLLRLGIVLGVTVMTLVVSYTIYYGTIDTTWDYIYGKYLEKTEPITNFTAAVDVMSDSAWVSPSVFFFLIL